MDTVTLRAYAKINLSLDVTGRREDGYHLLESVFQGVSLYDNIRVHREQGESGIRIRCNLPYIPTDERNIVHKVATAFFQAIGLARYQLLIELHKTIPSGAGFGGGSADGAAVFSALCRLYRRSFTTAEATEILAPIGADIPFFLYSGTMLAEGIGEVLTPAPVMRDCAIVLAKPRTSVSTKLIFERLREEEPARRPDTPGVLRALETGDLALLAESCANVLEEPAIAHCLRIGTLKEQLKRSGAILAQMSGSGSGVFGIFQTDKEARGAVQAMRRLTRFVRIVRPVCRPLKTE